MASAFACPASFGLRRHCVSLPCESASFSSTTAKPAAPLLAAGVAATGTSRGVRRAWWACATARREPSKKTVERSAVFDAAGRFFRPTSAVVRDLGVLAATVLANSLLMRRLRVLDACAGTGVRALRYLEEAPTDFVWTNDAQSQASTVLVDNLARYIAAGKARVTTSTLEEILDAFRSNIADAGAAAAEAGENRSSSTMNSPLVSGVDRHRFDLVDLDQFGACGFPEVDDALDVVNLSGGLLYLSSTDSVSAAGRNPDVARRVWRAVAKPHPAVNEQYLRLVIGACAQAAEAKNLEVKPVFSYFHPVSSTARVMVRVKSAKLPEMTQKKRPSASSELEGLGYVAHCAKCGQNGAFRMCSPAEAAAAVCPVCSATQDAEDAFVVSGPLWVGRLHNADYCREMRAIARARQSPTEDWRPACNALSAMILEAPLPPLFYTLGDVAKRIRTSTPPRQRIVDELANRGYVSSPSHCRPKCIKTNAPFEAVLEAARVAAEDVEAMVAAAKPP